MASQVKNLWLIKNQNQNLSLSIFSAKNSYYKNGIWWFTKMAARIVGEERWDTLRMARRIQANKIYYGRQQILFDLFNDWPENQLIQIDTSYGFLHWSTYEAYRDWQEHTFNSDGSWAMWIYLVCGVYIVYLIYSYMLPIIGQFNNSSIFPAKNEEFVRLRMKDAIASTVQEELFGNQFSEFGWAPHDFHYNRSRCMSGYCHPDDPRTMHMATFNRKHKYKEHYLKTVGEQSRMIG